MAYIYPILSCAQAETHSRARVKAVEDETRQVMKLLSCIPYERACPIACICECAHAGVRACRVVESCHDALYYNH